MEEGRVAAAVELRAGAAAGAAALGPVAGGLDEAGDREDLGSRDEVRERRAQAAHPPRVRPELVADGPDQVWTWDITKLKSQWRGLYFDLYVMLDIFSRKVIRWEVHVTETGDLAKAFIENAIIANGGARPDYIHADNGTSMTSKPVSQLLSDLNITDSHSRPHVSNDNPIQKPISRP